MRSCEPAAIACMPEPAPAQPTSPSPASRPRTVVVSATMELIEMSTPASR